MGLRRPGEITRKVNGELVSVTEETAQQLGQDVGVPAVTSPLMGASVGATPDQSKMLGSQANLRSAIRARTTPETLDRAQRTQQYETELDAGAKAQQEKLKAYFENIPGLGKLDEEMARIVQQRLMPDIKAQDQFLGVNWDAVGSFAGNRTDVLNIFAEIGFDRYDENNKLIEPASLLTRALRGEGISDEEFNTLNDTLARISKTMWGEDTAETLTLNDIKEFMNTPDDLIASQILKNKPNEITIGDIDDVTLTRLGLGPDYLNRIFGGENNWKGVTYARVKEQIQELQAAFADIRELERITSDPFASPTLIREANKRLRELGYIGKRSAMEKVNDLQAQIEDGDIVKVGEAIFEIEEILDDDDWMEAINFALQDEKAMERLQENNPELANWIGENRTALIKQYNEMTGYLTGTQNFSDFMVSREEREEIDADIEDFDPQLMAAARKELGIDVTDMDTLTNTQAQQLLAQSQTTVEGVWNTAIAGVPADFYADRGLNIYSMSEEELNRTAGELRDEYAEQKFSSSPYTADLNTLNGILSELGMTLDRFNDISGLAPVAGDLTASQWMWEAGEPNLTDQIEEATRLLTVKKIDDNNATIRDSFSGLDPALFANLGLNAASGVPISLNDTAKYIQDKMGSLTGPKKTNFIAITNAILSSTKSLPNGVKASSLFQTFIEANPASLVQETAKGSTDLINKFNNYVDNVIATGKSRPEDVKSADIWKWILPEGVDLETLKYLEGKTFKTSSGLSRLPSVLDSNGDGKLDTIADIEQRVKSGLFNIKSPLMLSALEKAGTEAQTLINQDKEAVARTTASKTYNTQRVAYYKQTWLKENKQANFELWAKEDFVPKYGYSGNQKLSGYYLGQLIDDLPTTASRIEGGDLSWIKDANPYNYKYNALSEEGKKWNALSPREKNLVDLYFSKKGKDAEYQRLKDLIPSRAASDTEKYMKSWKYEG